MSSAIAGSATIRSSFYPPRSCTFAQLSDDEKNAISHRRRAADALLAALAPMTEPLLLQRRRTTFTKSRSGAGRIRRAGGSTVRSQRSHRTAHGSQKTRVRSWAWRSHTPSNRNGSYPTSSSNRRFAHDGLGWRLLCEATREADAGARSGLLEAREADAALLFAGLEFRMRHRYCRLAGRIPREDELATMVAGEYRFVPNGSIFAAIATRSGELDLRTRGSEPDDDHPIRGEASGAAFFLRDEFVGYAYAWPDGRIGPLAAVSPTYLVAFFAFALVSLGRRYAASWCTALVPARTSGSCVLRFAPDCASKR